MELNKETVVAILSIVKSLEAVNLDMMASLDVEDTNVGLLADRLFDLTMNSLTRDGWNDELYDDFQETSNNSEDLSNFIDRALSQGETK